MAELVAGADGRSVGNRVEVVVNGLAEEVVDRLGYGPESLWSLLYAAQSAALTLALVEPLDQRLALTAAGDLLGDALDDSSMGTSRPVLR
jgi:hypothetical protein